MKVERLFVEHVEFDSKAYLIKRLEGTILPPVLNVILRCLEQSNKILADRDGSMVWIHASPKAKKSWDKAVRL